MRSSLACVIALLSAGLAPGATIVSVAGSADGASEVGGAADQMLLSAWLQTGTYSNVSISAEIGNGAGDGPTISAWLTNQIGPGTTVANQLAMTTILPSNRDEVDTLFTGLSLGPGTYYLILAAPGSEEGSAWLGTDSATITLDDGVIGNFNDFASISAGVDDDDFAPASTFVDAGLINLLMNVSGDLVTTPEPSSFVLIGLAGAFLLKARFRTRAR